MLGDVGILFVGDVLQDGVELTRAIRRDGANVAKAARTAYTVWNFRF